MSLRDLLLPLPPRRLTHARAWNVAFRTAHLAAIGTLLGGHVFGVPHDRLVAWLWASIGTGAALMIVEAFATLDWLMQVSGLLVLLKLLLLLRHPVRLGCPRADPLHRHRHRRDRILTCPASYRHYSLFYRRNMRGR